MIVEPDVHVGDVAHPAGPDPCEPRHRVRDETDPAHCNRFEHVGRLVQEPAAQALARHERSRQEEDAEYEDAPGAEIVPVDREERHRRGDDKEEPEVHGDDGTQAEHPAGRRLDLGLGLELGSGELLPQAVDLGRPMPVCCQPAFELVGGDCDVRAARVVRR